MNGPSPPKSQAWPSSPDNQALQYTKPPVEGGDAMSSLFRLTTVLHGLTDLGAISSALLSTLITEEGLGFDRAVLFLLDKPGRKLRGFDAAGERERELTRDFWRLLDRFPESLRDAVNLTLDPRRRLRSPLAKKARRLWYRLDDTTQAPVVSALSGSAVSFTTHGLADSPDLVQGLGEGPWSYWPVIGTRGVAGVLGVAGGYAQPLPIRCAFRCRCSPIMPGSRSSADRPTRIWNARWRRWRRCRKSAAGSCRPPIWRICFTSSPAFPRASCRRALP